MWRPPERIRYEATRGRMPSRAEAAAARLFQPVAIGPVQLEQRTWVPAMVPWRATDEGYVTEDVIDWYERFARGRPGAIVVEATGIREVPSGPLLRIGHDRFLPGLRRLTEAVQRASDGHTRLFIQLIDFLAIRRRPEPEKFFASFLTITDAHRRALGDPSLPETEVRARLRGLSNDELAHVLTSEEREALQFGYRERVTDVHLQHVRDLPTSMPGLFADAAARAQEAGFDGVELHYAHAYTMASFLSRTNTREDGYGGARENRARLPLDVFGEVRGACASILRSDAGSWPRSASTTAASLPIRSISASRSPRPGWIFCRPHAAESLMTPSSPASARRLIRTPAAAATSACRSSFPMRAARSAATSSLRRRSAARSAMPVSATPVVCTGGIHNFEMAEKLLVEDTVRRRRRRAPVARRSGLVPQDGTRPGRHGADLRIHELL